MPRGDGTGPMGMGPMTGRGAGYCTGYTPTRYVNADVGFAGFGCGRGFRRMFNASGMRGFNRFNGFNTNRTYAPSFDEKEFLSRQVKILEAQLADAKKSLLDIDDE